LRKHTLLALLIIALTQTAFARVELDEQTSVRFATRDQATQILGAKDGFARALGSFDRSARLQATENVSTAQVLDFMSRQARSFTDDEKSRVTELLASIRRRLRELGWDLPLPRQVLLVKASSRLENGFPHCRQNAIILPNSTAGLRNPDLKLIIIHELFHILTIAAPDLQERLYAVVGFKPCPGVSFPKQLTERKVTNPDAFGVNYCAELEYQGRPIHATPILLSPTATYDPSRDIPFIEYARVRFLVVEKEGEKWACRYKDGSPMVLKRSEVSGYLDKVGRNTGYIIHPEEVLAQNFMFIVRGREEFRTPEIPAEMTKVLRQCSKEGTKKEARAVFRLPGQTSPRQQWVDSTSVAVPTGILRLPTAKLTGPGAPLRGRTPAASPQSRS